MAVNQSVSQCTVPFKALFIRIDLYYLHIVLTLVCCDRDSTVMDNIFNFWCSVCRNLCLINDFCQSVSQSRNMMK